MFRQEHFIGSEESGNVVVFLVIEGGTSTSSFEVTVTPSEQSPPSAEGCFT